MKYPIRISKRLAVVFVMAAAIVVATGLLEFGRGRGQVANANTPQRSDAKSNASPSEASVDLSSSQLNSIKIEPVGSYLFPVEKETVGNISFADDLSVQVFPPYQGKLIKDSSNWATTLKKASRSTRLIVPISSRPNQL